MNEITSLLNEYQVPPEFHKAVKGVVKHVLNNANLSIAADIADSLHTMSFVMAKAAEKYGICTEADIEAAKQEYEGGGETDGHPDE